MYAVREIIEEEGITDKATLDAALLHDVLEDTALTKYYLGLKFGKRVADIVEILSKQPCWKTGHCKMKSNLDEMEIAWEEYPEAIIIKIADRLHNLRTIHGFSRKKQIEYLVETKELLIPLFKDTIKHTHLGDLKKWMDGLLQKLLRQIQSIEKNNQ